MSKSGGRWWPNENEIASYLEDARDPILTGPSVRTLWRDQAGAEHWFSRKELTDRLQFLRHSATVNPIVIEKCGAVRLTSKSKPAPLRP